MAQALWYLGRFDVLFWPVSSQKVEFHLPTTDARRDENYSDHGTVDHAGNPRKYGDGSGDEGLTVLMPGIRL